MKRIVLASICFLAVMAILPYPWNIILAIGIGAVLVIRYRRHRERALFGDSRSAKVTSLVRKQQRRTPTKPLPKITRAR